MRREDFEQGLRELEQAYAKRPLPTGLELPQRNRRLRNLRLAVTWVPVVAVGVIAALVLVSRLAAPATVGGFSVEGPRGAFTAEVAGDGTVRARGRGQLVDEALETRLEVDREASIARTESGSRILSGAVTYEVAHRKKGQRPYSVRTSHGTIEVKGTRFSVVQQADGGQVTLHRGAIEFHSLDGRVWPVAPGETFHWPPPPETAAPPAPATPAADVRDEAVRPAPVTAPHPAKRPPKAVEPDEEPAADLTAVLAQVAVLRSRGSYEQAAQLLARELAHPRRDSTDERLSFELGTILTHQLNDGPRACAHWAAHSARYPKGRYVAEVDAAVLALGCAQKPPR